MKSCSRIVSSFSLNGRQLLYFSITLILFLPFGATAEVIDRVIAEVNNEVVTLSELEEEGRTLFAKIRREAPISEQQEALALARNQILTTLIDKKLIAQEAAKKGVSVSEEEMETAYAQVRSANGISRERFVEQLRQSGIDEQMYRSNLKSQLLQNKLVMREVHSKVFITDEMVLDYYQQEYTKEVDEGSFYLLQIGIGWGATEAAQQSTTALYEDKLAARKRAERVHNLARSGEDFRELARRFSDLPSADEGGDIGIFAENEMADYMKQAVAQLQPGEISDIVETPFGYQFFKLLSGNTGGVVMHAPYETVKEEIRERLFRQALQKEYEAWLKRIREAAYIRK